MQKILLIALLVVACSLSQATAVVTISLEGGIVYQQDGTTAVADGRMVYAVALPSGDFFPISTAGWVSGDNLILGNFWLTDFDFLGEDGGFSTILVFNLSGGIASGQQFGFLWFPTLTDQSSNPSAGTPYGFYTQPSYIIPSDGDTASFSFETVSIGGSIPDALGAASLQVVPEPSSAALIGIGAACLYLLRRRAKAPSRS